MSGGEEECPTLPLCIFGLAGVFRSHAGADGKLNTAELTKLLKEEMPGMGGGNKEKMVAKMISDLDGKDKDGLMDFQEFMTLVTVYACVLYEMIIEEEGK